MVRRWSSKASLHDHAVTVAQARMTRRAVDIKPLSTVRKYRFSDWKWHVVTRVIANFPGVEIRVFMLLPARYRSLHRRPGGSQICEEIAFGQRLVPRLIMHILPASRQK